MQLLGCGSYGSVYLYQDADMTLALKTVTLKPGRCAALIEPILVSSLDHPYVAKSLWTHIENNTLYMAFPLADTDLHRWRNEHRPTNEQLRLYSWQLLQALDYLHKHNIIHADVKLQNVLVYDDHVELTDFSLARMKRWSQAYSPTTYVHRAPEVWRGQPWDEGVDIWALGISLYELAYDVIPTPYRLVRGWDKTEECIQLYSETFNNWDINALLSNVRVEHQPIDDLISRCLQVHDRPTADMLLRLPWFEGLSLPESDTNLNWDLLAAELVDDIANRRTKLMGWYERIVSLNNRQFNIRQL